MLRDEAVARLQRTLGFRTDKSVELIDALKDAQVQLEKLPELPWFLLTEVASISTVAEEERVPLPKDFILEWEEDPLWYFNASADDEDKWTRLEKDTFATLRKDLPGAGSPLAYTQDGDYFRIFPTPDAVYVLKMIYYKTDEVLISNIENFWLKHFPYLVIGEAGRLIPGFRDKEALKIFTQWAAEGRAAMRIQTEARRHSTRRYVMGGPD